MIHEFGADPHVADFEIHRVQLLDVDLSRQIVKRDRKKRRCHLTFENLAQTAAGSIVTKDLDLIFVVVGRHEKREALNVVPMNVSNEQTQIDGTRAEFIFKSESEFSNARTGVQDNQLTVRSDFETTRVAAIAHRSRTRNRNGPANAPNFQTGRQSRWRRHK